MTARVSAAGGRIHLARADAGRLTAVCGQTWRAELANDPNGRLVAVGAGLTVHDIGPTCRPCKTRQYWPDGRMVTR